MTLKKALDIVVNESNDDYAKNYALASLSLGGSCESEMIESNGLLEIKHKATGKIMIGREMKTQLLYILCNLRSWRGEKAREIKKVLKAYSK